MNLGLSLPEQSTALLAACPFFVFRGPDSGFSAGLAVLKKAWGDFRISGADFVSGQRFIAQPYPTSS
jgi:hypothetical protein